MLLYLFADGLEAFRPVPYCVFLNLLNKMFLFVVLKWMLEDVRTIVFGKVLEHG